MNIERFAEAYCSDCAEKDRICLYCMKLMTYEAIVEGVKQAHWNSVLPSDITEAIKDGVRQAHSS